MAAANGLRWALLFCNLVVLGLSVFGLLRGSLASLIVSIILIIWSAVGMFGIWKEKLVLTKANMGLFVLWICIYIALVVTFFYYGDWTGGGINIAFVLFGLIALFINYKYVKVM